MSNNTPTQIIFARSHSIRSTEWTKLLGGVGQDTAYDLEIDEDGSIYVVGVTQSSFDEQENAGSMDGFITKFDKDGEKIWTRILGTYSRDVFQKITIGNDGSVYVGGGTWGNIDGQTHSNPNTSSNERYSRASDAFVTKYSSDGEKIWTRILNTRVGDLDNNVKEITTDVEGNIYKTGITSYWLLPSRSKSIFSYNFADSTFEYLSKYNQEGVLEWVKFSDENINSILENSDNTNLIESVQNDLEGKTYTSSEYIQLFGEINQYDSSQEDAYFPGGVDEVTNSQDDGVFVAGSLYTSDYRKNVFALLKYNNDGSKEWKTIFGSDQFDRLEGLEIDDNGYIFMVGSFGAEIDGQTYNGGYYDAFIKKIDPSTQVIDENISANSIIFNLFSLDQNSSQTHIYELVNGDGDKDNTLFTIEGNNLKINSSPDYETQSSYNIRLKTTDIGGLSYEEAFTLSVNNIIELIESSTDLILPNHTENLTLTGSGNINGTGNRSPNTIRGNSGANRLNGGAGADTLFGNAGNDILNGGLGDDTMYGGDGTDTAIFSSRSNSINLALSTAQNTIDGIDTLSSIENVNAGGGDDIVRGNSGANRLNGGAGADTLFGNAGNDILNGGLGNDTLYGGDGTDTAIFSSRNNRINLALSTAQNTIDGIDTLSSIENVNSGGGDDIVRGNSGANRLNGGTGTDILIGGAGNDTYIVDRIGDVIREESNQGTDLVQSSATYILRNNNVENLTLTGSSDINGTGNASANTIKGNSGANRLNGGAGTDILIGGAGDDTYIVDNFGDVVREVSNQGTDLVQSYISFKLGDNLENLTLKGSSNVNGTGNASANTIRGNSGANRLIGGAGNDILNGGSGIDDMRGGDGNDTYIVDRTGDVITEESNQGTDLVQSSANYILRNNNVENLTLTGSSDINGTGNASANTIKGNSGANRLNGGAGNDILNGGSGIDDLRGGAGNDTYIVDRTGDFVRERSNQGTDLVQSSANYILRNNNVENLTLTGSSDINGTGNASANTIKGNSGANRLNGKAGADILIGNAGNDILDGGSGIDDMRGGAGNDTYIVDRTGDVIKEGSGNGTDLVQSSASYTISNNIENLTLKGSEDINGTGNNSANTIKGNSGDNTLRGGAGADTIYGNGGDDVLLGGFGNDRLVGGGGDDIFQLTKGNGYDRIVDFEKGKDSIDIQNFDNIGIIRNGNHSNIYNGQDLLAIVFNENDFTSSGNGFLI